MVCRVSEMNEKTNSMNEANERTKGTLRNKKYYTFRSRIGRKKLNFSILKMSDTEAIVRMSWEKEKK